VVRERLRHRPGAFSFVCGVTRRWRKADLSPVVATDEIFPVFAIGALGNVPSSG
jgi:hypothetical protein